MLERGCVYIVPLLEGLSLRHRMSAMGNPKSSTGRLDVFTRLITDYGTEFDRVREQYKGPLYAEVSPRTFSVLVRKGSRLSQIRIRRGKPAIDGRVDAPPPAGASGRRLDDQRRRHPERCSRRRRCARGSDGRPHRLSREKPRRLIDIDSVDHYDPGEFWEPVHAPKRGGLILDPAEFYILASRDPVQGAADARGGDDRL